MTLDEAARAWRELGIIQMRNQGDHCCAAPLARHAAADCPLAPYLIFTAEDVAEITDEAGLDHLLTRKLQEDYDATNAGRRRTMG